MEGLEATEISFSDLENTLRVDADYYSPRFVALDEKIRKGKFDTLVDLGRFIPGPFGSEFHVENFVDSGTFRYVRGKDVKPFFVTDNDNVYMPDADFKRMEEFALQENDVLVSVVGTLGNASLVTADVLPAIYSCKSTVFRSGEVDARYLVAFLNSELGRKLLLRRTRGTVQTGLNLPDLRAIELPRYSDGFEKAVSEAISKSQASDKDSKSLYAQAETLLLRALKLDDWQPPVTNNYTVRSGSVWDAARLDADHFHPKFQAMLDHIKLHAKRCEVLADLCLMIEHGKQPPYSDDGSAFLFSQKYIGRTGINYDFPNDEDATRIDDEFAAQNSDFLLRRNDLLHYSVGAYIGRTQPFLEDEPLAMPGSFITLIRANQNKIHPIYLGCVLNSIVGQMQTDKMKSASAQPYIYPKDIRQFLVPFVAPDVEKEIVRCVEESHAAKRRAKSLLERAKRAVEVAIETDEAAGLAVLEKQ